MTPVHRQLSCYKRIFKDFVRRLAAEMAEEFKWDENWLNDGVKGWLSNRDTDPDVKALFKTYPSEDLPGLRVYTAKPEYLFAMKCRAMRVGGIETNLDIDDIKLLARAIGISNSYPKNMLQPKTRLGLEAIFSLDSFYVNTDSRQLAIEERPASVDAVHDAYVAAVAEHLARVYGLRIPEWSETHGNELREPFFAGDLQSLKGVVVAESPTAFRRRLLFVSKDALSRPRM